jgi:hypothetical protein
LLHTIKSSLDYDPQHDLARIETKVYALDFDDDEFNPAQLLILESLLKHVPQAKYTSRLERTSAAGWENSSESMKDAFAVARPTGRSSMDEQHATEQAAGSRFGLPCRGILPDCLNRTQKHGSGKPC